MIRLEVEMKLLDIVRSFVRITQLKGSSDQGLLERAATGPGSKSGLEASQV